MFRLLRLLTLLIAVVSITACGREPGSSAEQDRKAEEYAKSFGAKVDVQTRTDGTTSVAVDRSLGAMKAQVGTDLAVPEGFSKDVPVFPGLKIASASQMPGMGFMIQGRSSAALPSVAGFYAAEMKAQGWAAERSQQTPAMHMYQFKKGERTASVTFFPDGEGTTVQIMAMPAS